MDSNALPIPILVIGIIVFLGIGALWSRFFWKVIDPGLRRVLGRLLRTTIHLGEQNIWRMNLESEDSLNWRNMFIRPVQMIALVSAGFIPLVITLIIILKLFAASQ